MLQLHLQGNADPMGTDSFMASPFVLSSDSQAQSEFKTTLSFFLFEIVEMHLFWATVDACVYIQMHLPWFDFQFQLGF